MALERINQLSIQITEQIKYSIEKGMYGCGNFIDLKWYVWMWDLYRP